MTVAVSMLNLVPGAMGGSETYARELLRELAVGPLDVHTVVAPVARGFSAPLPETVVEQHPGGASGVRRVEGLAWTLLRHRRLRQLLAETDVVHYPFTVPLPAARASARTVVTLLDVQHRDLPGLFSLAERSYRRLAYDSAARRADAVVTISEFCRQQILHHLRIDPGRVHVAPLGVRTQEFAPGSPEREPFLLYPARAWRHKNHETLFDAFRHLRRSLPQLRLVLTGCRPDELGDVPAGVDVRGRVAQDELVALYRTASALVFPSLYEGFGLPVLEAMAAGCPVAASRRGALPEVLGGAGVLFEPENAADVARAVMETLERRDELAQGGRRQAAQFTWERCARVHADLYMQLGG